jgi:hypothetical protein
MHFLYVTLGKRDGVYRIDDLASLLKVKWVYSFVINILLIGIEIDHLATVAAVMEKQAVVRTSIADEPMHRTQYIGSGRHSHLIVRIGILQNDHIVRLKSKTLDEFRDIHDVVDTSAKGMLGADVIDSNQEGLQSVRKTDLAYLSSSVALGVLILVLIPKLRMEVHSALRDRDEVRLAKRGRGASRMIW